MTLIAFIFVILSASLHVAWNLKGKKNQGQASFIPLAFLMGGLLALPSLFFSELVQWLNADRLLWIVATGFFQALYISGLSLSYRHSDMSLCYPLIRGLPVLCVALCSVILFNHTPLSPSAWLGIACIFLASFWLRLERTNTAPKRSWAGICLAVAGTTGYSLIDAHVMQQLNTANDHWLTLTLNGLSYSALQALTACLWLALMSLPKINKDSLSKLKSHPISLSALTQAGTFMIVSYLFILIAMPMADDVSYIVACRQISIPLSIAVSYCLLKEAPSLHRWGASVLMLSGIIFVSL